MLLIVLFRHHQGDKKLFFALAGPMLPEKEFFIRKAIGWTLRELSKADPDSVLRHADTYIKSRAFLQVMNHPDINLSALREVWAKLPNDARANWTAIDMAVWWKKHMI